MRFSARLRHYFVFLFIPRGRTPAYYFAGALANAVGAEPRHVILRELWWNVKGLNVPFAAPDKV